MTDEQATIRLAALALDATIGEEPQTCIEHGCLMMIAVMRLPDRVRLGMATVFMDFARVLEVMHNDAA